MSQQNLDVRTAFRIAAKRKRIVGAVAALGLLLGGAGGYLTPPMLKAAALVVVSQAPSPQGSQQQDSGTGTGTGSGTGTDSLLATQAVIASSDPVLAAALPHVSPAMTLDQLSHRVTVAAVGSSDILSISGTGKTARQAEDTADAVAASYVSYVTGSADPAVQAQAKVIEQANVATGTKPAVHTAGFAVAGLAIASLLALIIALAIGRADRRLVQRDAIANSIATPVLASLPAERPADPQAWARLLTKYEPDVVHAYGLSKLLQQLGVSDDGQGSARTSLMVLSLLTDPAALALGPQLAAFAASQGIATTLVLGPHQDANVVASLRTACAASAWPADGSGRPLRCLVSEDGNAGRVHAAFTVTVAVVDGQDPRLPETARSTATVLGVSAGGATAEQLARAAMAAAADGRDVVGIVVANPDPSDQTTGRIPRLAPMRRPLPTKISGPAVKR